MLTQADVSEEEIKENNQEMRLKSSKNLLEPEPEPVVWELSTASWLVKLLTLNCTGRVGNMAKMPTNW